MKKIKLFCVIILFVTITLGISMSCSDINSNKGAIQWKAYPDNPVIGYTDQKANIFWNDPSVLKEDNIFHMWLSGGDVVADPLTDNTLPYYASSCDGISWTINTTPLFNGGGVGTYDGYKVETPSVVKKGGIYHMYYTSRSNPGDEFTISHATSANVDSGWTRDGANPVLSPTGTITEWNGAQVAEPAIVIKDNKFYLFFTAVGCRDAGCSTYPSSAITKPIRSIGLAISTDGTNFDPPTQVLTQGAMYPESENYEGYSTPHVYLEGSQFQLYYDVYQYLSSIDEQKQIAIHYAVSSDGNSWTEDLSPIFKRTDFSWTEMSIRAPAVIIDNGTRKMWFAGNKELPISNREDAGIGYAYTE